MTSAQETPQNYFTDYMQSGTRALVKQTAYYQVHAVDSDLAAAQATWEAARSVAVARFLIESQYFEDDEKNTADVFARTMERINEEAFEEAHYTELHKGVIRAQLVALAEYTYRARAYFKSLDKTTKLTGLPTIDQLGLTVNHR